MEFVGIKPRNAYFQNMFKTSPQPYSLIFDKQTVTGIIIVCSIQSSRQISQIVGDHGVVSNNRIGLRLSLSGCVVERLGRCGIDEDRAHSSTYQLVEGKAGG